MNINWIKIVDASKEVNNGKEVLGFNDKWIDQDKNPSGVRTCFTSENGTYNWVSSRYCPCNGGYISDFRSTPTHFSLIPNID